MQDFLIPPVWLCVVAFSALLILEWRGYYRWEWLSKPLAALAFIWAALSWGAMSSSYGQWILLGLLLCAVGDVLLIPKGQSRWFQMGIAAFLLGHVAYLLAFVCLPLDVAAGVLAALVTTLAMAIVLKWLLPSVPADFKLPVLVYMAVISMMVIAAASVVFAGGHPLLLLGAVGFAISDLSVARNRFVAPGFANRVWGLPLYFLSQLVIAWTVTVI